MPDHTVQVLSPALLHNQQHNENWFLSLLPSILFTHYASNADGQDRATCCQKKTPVLDFGKTAHQPLRIEHCFAPNKPEVSLLTSIKRPLWELQSQAVLLVLNVVKTRDSVVFLDPAWGTDSAAWDKITLPHPMQYLFCKYTVSVSRTIGLMPLKMPSSPFFQLS